MVLMADTLPSFGHKVDRHGEIDGSFVTTDFVEAGKRDTSAESLYY